MMKKITYIIIFCVAQLAMAQFPTDYIARYEFATSTAGTFNNRVQPLGRLTDIAGTGTAQQIPDRFNRSLQALRLAGTQFTSDQTLFNQNAMSFSFWYRGGSNAGSAQSRIFRLQSISSSADRAVVFSRKANNVFNLRIQGNGNPNRDHDEVIAINDLQWHHIAVVVDVTPGANDDIRVYVDNALVPGFSTALNQNRNNLLTQASYRLILGETNRFIDALDNFQMYRRALSSTEVSQLFNQSQPQAIIYVDADATGTGNGTSWSNAYTNPVLAFAQAEEDSQIWVAEGTYNLNASSRAASFRLPFGVDGIKIYGGFNGTETTLAQRDFNTNPTVFTGDNALDDVGAAGFNNVGNRIDNAYNVIVIQADNTTIDGVEITGGNATGQNVAQYLLGAAIFKIDEVNSLILRNNKFYGNVATGGAAFFGEFRNPSITGNLIFVNNVVRNNIGRYGTGVFTGASVSGVDADISISNNLFYYNVNEDLNSTDRGISGTAMWVRANVVNTTVNATVTNNVIYGNTDRGTIVNVYKAAAAFDQSSGATMVTNFSNNIVWENRNGNGDLTEGVAHIRSGASSSPGTMLFANNMYDFNDNHLVSNTSQVTMQNNSNAFPGFGSTTTPDFRPFGASSNLVDAGDNSLVDPNITQDLDGNNRIAGSAVDIGAYEFGATASIGDERLNEVRVFPNPVMGYLIVEGDFAFAKAELFSISGQKIIESTTNKLDLNGIDSGIYLVKIYDESGNSVTRKVMKK